MGGFEEGKDVNDDNDVDHQYFEGKSNETPS